MKANRNRWANVVAVGAVFLVALAVLAAYEVVFARRGTTQIHGTEMGQVATREINTTKVSSLYTSIAATIWASPPATRQRPEHYETATPDLRPTPPLNFAGLPHRWTDSGVILSGKPDDFANCLWPDESSVPHVINQWLQVDDPENAGRLVYAGASGGGDPPTHSAVFVADRNPCEWIEYPSALADGPLEIIAARGHELALRSEFNGQIVYFNLDRRAYTAGFLTPTPGPTPTTWKSPSDDLSDYVVVARDAVYIGPLSSVAGSVAVLGPEARGAGTLELKNGVTVDVYGCLAAASVVLGPHVFVPGDVFFGSIKRSPSAQVLGSLVSPPRLSLAFPTYPDFDVAKDSPHLAVSAGNETTAEPGQYIDIRVGRGATLVLRGGTYDVGSVRIEADGEIACEAAATRCEIRVSEEVSLGPRASIGHLRPSRGGRGVVIYVGGQTPKGFRTEKDATVSASVFTPEGRITLGPNGRFTGAFIAREVDAKANSALSLESAFGQGQ